MRIIIHAHALAHGLTPGQVQEAFETGSNGATIRYRDRASEPQRWATVGFDAQGRAIELVFIRGNDNAVLIIHANYLTQGFAGEIRTGRK